MTAGELLERMLEEARSDYASALEDFETNRNVWTNKRLLECQGLVGFLDDWKEELKDE